VVVSGTIEVGAEARVRGRVLSGGEELAARPDGELYGTGLQETGAEECRRRVPGPRRHRKARRKPETTGYLPV
jgi:hypothetical protein